MSTDEKEVTLKKATTVAIGETKKQVKKAVLEVDNTTEALQQECVETLVDGQQKAQSVVQETRHQLHEAVQDAQKQVIAAVTESAEQLEAEAKLFNTNIQVQLGQIKQEILQRINVFKAHYSTSKQSLIELKNVVKIEYSTVIEELSKLSKELKIDVGQISSKHKDHLNETFKRSKENTLEVWKKIGD